MSRDIIKIHSIVAAPLMGESPKGGWPVEIRPDDSVHALIAVHTDAGITGYGSMFTNGGLVAAALKVLEPLFLGENALEPERVSEKLNQNSFWMGRGGSLTHTISGIDIALWDVLGKALGQPVGRLLGGVYRTRVKPYCSLLMEEPDKMAATLRPYRDMGFRAFKIGWGPFGRRESTRNDEAIIAAARGAVGDDSQLLVGAGASDAYWPNGLRWAINTAHMLAGYGTGWFEEALKPDAHSRGRGADAPAKLHALADAGSLRHRATRCDESGRHFGAAPDCMDGRGIWREVCRPWLEYGTGCCGLWLALDFLGTRTADDNSDLSRFSGAASCEPTSWSRTQIWCR